MWITCKTLVRLFSVSYPRTKGRIPQHRVRPSPPIIPRFSRVPARIFRRPFTAVVRGYGMPSLTRITYN